MLKCSNSLDAFNFTDTKVPVDSDFISYSVQYLLKCVHKNNIQHIVQSKNGMGSSCLLS